MYFWVLSECPRLTLERQGCVLAREFKPVCGWAKQYGDTQVKRGREPLSAVSGRRGCSSRFVCLKSLLSLWQGKLAD